LPQNELNLRDYLRIFHKRKYIILLSFLVGLIGSIIFFPEPPPLYKSSTTVKVQERKTIAGMLTDWVVYNPGDIMASQTMIIKGFPIIQKVALRLGIVNSDSSTKEIHRVVNDIQNRIETTREGQTNIIRITTLGKDARETRDLAKTVAEVYREENLLEKTEQARQTRTFIEEQLSSLEQRLRGAEDLLKEYEYTVGDVEGLKEDTKEIDPVYEKLVDLKFRLAAMSQRYTEKHPEMIRLQKEIENLEGQQDVVLNSNDLNENDADYKLQYARLHREVEVNKKLYMMFKEKFEEARITEAQKIGDVSIIDPAVIPSSPVNTQGKLNTLMGGLLGLIVGIALAFIIETMDSSLGKIEDIEHVMKLPVLGVVPSARTELKNNSRNLRKFEFFKNSNSSEMLIRLMVHHHPRSIMAEAIRNIRTHLKLGDAKRTILVTSAGPGEGKTTIMVNLGLSVAQTGAKTLLVSSDLRRPAIAKTFGTKRVPGLAELLSGEKVLEEVLRNISDFILGDMRLDEITKSPGLDNLWILPAGRIPVNPAEFLEDKKLTDLLEELKKKFDFVFLDSPPLLPVADASILASRVDSVVICYEIGKIHREAILRAKSQLESVGAHILGIVLNQIKTQASTVEAYPYYTSYKYRYQEKHTA
jgi:tyrosine-protein kinase Etk/Wzc